MGRHGTYRPHRDAKLHSGTLRKLNHLTNMTPFTVTELGVLLTAYGYHEELLQEMLETVDKADSHEGKDWSDLVEEYANGPNQLITGREDNFDEITDVKEQFTGDFYLHTVETQAPDHEETDSPDVHEFI
jgi:hypothetical protein